MVLRIPFMVEYLGKTGGNTFKRRWPMISEKKPQCRVQAGNGEISLIKLSE